MAAGLGTRLRPITHEVPKPVVPVGNVAIVEQLVALLAAHGVDEVIANLHWFPETVKRRLGDGSKHGVAMSYRREEELTRDRRRRSQRLRLPHRDRRRHLPRARRRRAHRRRPDQAARRSPRQRRGCDARRQEGQPTSSEYGVIVTGPDGRIEGFQEKPNPAEALSDLVNCMVYAFSPEVFDYFPAADSRTRSTSPRRFPGAARARRPLPRPRDRRLLERRRHASRVPAGQSRRRLRGGPAPVPCGGADRRRRRSGPDRRGREDRRRRDDHGPIGDRSGRRDRCRRPGQGGRGAAGGRVPEGSILARGIAGDASYLASGEW